ncbi:MAG: hypothetical protein K5683_02765 [Prevotella sp.]|nr:hypothetical protein [Prevotella sp.]
MATINLTVNKQIFDHAVPAAKEPKGTVFAKMQECISDNMESIASELLGDVGINAANAAPTEKLAVTLMHAACIGAVLANLRSMDLVLTATGFGVVSTNDTAPASKMRVDALEEELARHFYIKYHDLHTLLFSVVGWADQIEQKQYPCSLFYHFSFLSKFAGFTHPKAKDWDLAIPVIGAADEFIIKHISYAYHEELLDEMRSNSVSTHNGVIIYYIRSYIGACIQGRADTAEEIYKRMMNIIEDDLDDYPTYRDSEAYETNHFEGYENKREEGAYHFLG